MSCVVHWFDVVDSTNTTARDGRFRHGDVVATRRQTHGRGRLDREWHMDSGDGIAMTVVLSRSALDHPQALTRLPIVAAVALAHTLRERGAAAGVVTVKWPNDVHIGGRKVAGILAETLDTDRIGVGIGINLTGIPAGLSSKTVTTLTDEGIDAEPESLVRAVADAILRDARQLDDGALLDALTDALDTIGRAVRVELPNGRIVTGEAQGLGQSGSLLIDTGTTVEEFVAGDVTHLRHARD